MCTSRKKKIATPVMRCSTHDHMPSRPRYSVPAGRFGIGMAGVDGDFGARVPAGLFATSDPSLAVWWAVSGGRLMPTLWTPPVYSAPEGTFPF